MPKNKRKGKGGGLGANLKTRGNVAEEEIEPTLAEAFLRPNSSLRGEAIAAAIYGEMDIVSEPQEESSDGEVNEEESEAASQTLGEEDSDSTPGVRQNARKANAAVSSAPGDTTEKQNGPKNPWENKQLVASLFAGNRKPENGMKLQQFKLDDGPIKFDEGDLHKDDWNNCLVGYFGGKFPGKRGLEQLVLSWKEKATIHFHASGWIIFKFSTQEGRDSTLQEGPYTVFGRPLLLKILPDYFTFDYQEISCFPIWIRLNNLPIECWCEYGLSKICSRIGKPIYTDKLTARKERLSYARVLVEVDVAKPISHVIEFTMPNGQHVHQSVYYEHLPLFCTHCKTVGHSTSGCRVLEKFAAARNKGAKIQDATGARATKNPEIEAGQKAELSQQTEIVTADKSAQENRNSANSQAATSNSESRVLKGSVETGGTQSQIMEARNSADQARKIASDNGQAAKQQKIELGRNVCNQQTNQIATEEVNRKFQQQSKAQAASTTAEDRKKVALINRRFVPAATTQAGKTTDKAQSSYASTLPTLVQVNKGEDKNGEKRRKDAKPPEKKGKAVNSAEFCADLGGGTPTQSH